MIKSKIKEANQVNEPTYPCLMKFDGGEDVAVLLFISESSAMILVLSLKASLIGILRACMDKVVDYQ